MVVNQITFMFDYMYSIHLYCLLFIGYEQYVKLFPV